MKDYDQLILSRVDRSFNTILGITSIIAFIASILLYVADLPNIYAFVNLVTGVILLLFFIYAGRLTTVNKVVIVVVATTAVAIASYIGGGFTSAFFILLILSNVVADLFLKFKWSIVASIVLLVVISSLMAYSVVVEGIYIMTWILQVNGYILLNVVLLISAHAIKKYLMETIYGLEKSVEYANHLAYYDQLTGLPNAIHFISDVKMLIDAKKYNGYLMFLKFKSLSIINSTLGHDVGDKTLEGLAGILVRSCTDDMYLARIGGNEFAIWVPLTAEDGINWLYTRIEQAITQESNRYKKKLELMGSCAAFDISKDTFDDTYRRAALALTFAIEKGFTGLTTYDVEIAGAMEYKEAIKDSVEMAIAKEEFVLYYQGQRDTQTDTFIGVEGLARWNSSKLGWTSPASFIPVIESMGLSREFGGLVIDMACRDYNGLKSKYGEGITVSINISPSHIVEADVVKTVDAAMKKYGIPKGVLTLEITEDIVIEGIKGVKSILRELRALGVSISLDDFGSGYSALNYLLELELDELKIDKSFVDQLDNNTMIHILIENIIKLAKRFNLKVVAEGVETKAQCERLKALGCDVIQGYYLSRPEALLCDLKHLGANKDGV